ncbi:MAG: hypothetical protein GY804_09300 [Alphaproteobacteria bacterium]|nr:hypothetical protein [Alphaproteobacteria bacterium]
MTTRHLKKLMSDISDHYNGKMKAEDRGIETISEMVTKAVDGFTDKNGLDGASSNYGTIEINTALDIDRARKQDLGDIYDLVETCSLDGSAGRAAAGILATDIYKGIATKSGRGFISLQNASNPFNTDTSIGNLASIYSGKIPSAQAFGEGVDDVSADLRMAMYIDIMQFHKSITGKLVHINPTSDALIRYPKVEAIVFSNEEPGKDQKETRFVDMYEDPDIVSPELPAVVPLKTNGAPEDGFIPQGEFDLFALSTDPNKPGFGTYGRSDVIADSVFIASVPYTVSNATDTEKYALDVGPTIGKLVFTTNDEASKRVVTYDRIVSFGKDSLQADLTPTVIFSGLPDGEVIDIRLMINVALLLRTGKGTCIAHIQVKDARNIMGMEVSQGTKDLVTLLRSSPAMVGTGITMVELAAKFSEENLRKSHIELETRYSEKSFPLPPGANYFYTTSLWDVKSKTKDPMSLLTGAISVGQDGKNLDDLRRIMSEVSSAVNISNHGKYIGNDIGDRYPAGAIVRPYISTGNLDAMNFRTAAMKDLPYDVKQYIITQITYIVEELHSASMITNQMNGRLPEYTVITSGPILAKLFGMPRQQVDNAQPAGAYTEAGSAYRLTLDNGVKITIISSTFTKVADRIMGMLWNPDPNSPLSFAKEWSFGTAVAHYTKSGDAVTNRMVANARAHIIPLCPVGFDYSVTNLDKVLNAYKPVIDINVVEGHIETKDVT